MKILNSVLAIFVFVAVCATSWSQTAATGALTGAITDPSGALMPGAEVTVSNPATGAVRKITTNARGAYTVDLLPPGTYNLSVSATGFKTEERPGVNVSVAATATLNLSMQVGQQTETVSVESTAALLQSDSSALGGVVGEKEVKNLPLTSRNYTQILALFPGVAGDVNDAAQLGRNSQDVFVNGAHAIDNNFQMDGVEINNFGTGRSGEWIGYTGIAIPNPDTIQEFRVQTNMFDAGFGRGAGANVDVVTKSGTNDLHGDIFEFFRNEKLNANDFFLNQENQTRPILKQNQFGGTIGGPIVRNRLFFFGSYQGTRQVNGQGASSLQSSFLPALTNDRSAATIGKEFCGQSGFYGGAAIACNGSNVNQVALALLNYKLPNGQYLIPTPQTIQSNGLGFSVFSIPSRFTEDQYLVNTDYQISEKNTLSERFFYSNDPQTTTFTSSNVPGSGAGSSFQNRNAVLKLSSILTPKLVNEAKIGFTRNYGNLQTLTPAITSQIGMTPANPAVQTLPVISVSGLFSLGGNWNDNFATADNHIVVGDQISWSHNQHTIRAGFEFEWINYNFDLLGGKRGSLNFLSFPDFLLGESTAKNGTSYSNLQDSSYTEGITDRRYITHVWSSFIQDDIKVNSRLTLNLGLRWEIYSGLTEQHGRLSNFWPSIAQNNFDAAGQTYSGFVVASNFPGSTPAGVLRNTNSTCCLRADPQNWGPRFGLAWKPFDRLPNLAVRTGYGIFYSPTAGNNYLQLATIQPYSVRSDRSGPQNTLATFQVPFNPAPPSESSFPIWFPRTLTSNFTFEDLLPDWRPPIIQQFNFNIEDEFRPNWLLQAGYVGSRGTHLLLAQTFNQALLASPQNPVNGITTNSVENAYLRVPVLGYSPFVYSFGTEGFSWYNSLQLGLTKRFSHGLQFQASYTWDKSLDDVPDTTGLNATWGGFFSGDNYNRRQAWGPSDFDRTQRFVLSYLYDLPNFNHNHGVSGKLLSGWSLSGVTTIQNGHPLTITATNSGSIVGIYGFGRAQACPGSTAADVATSGSVTARLNNYFNQSAFCPLPAIGDGFGFGSLGRGVVKGPGQANYDIAGTKRTTVGGIRENAYLEFRGEFFNAFNHAQFADPATGWGLANFGLIGGTSVAPRLIQFALKYVF